VGDLEQLKCISFVVALLVSTSSLAQKYFGISGGVASNVLSGSEIDFQKKLYNNKMSSRTGPTFSLFLKKELTPYVYLRYEVAYARKGNVSPNNGLWNLNLEYVSVPLKFGFQPINSYNLSKDVQAGIEGGVSFNYALGNGTKDLAAAYSSATKAKVSQFGVSVLFGANLEYRLSPKRILFFNGTWYHDVTPLISYEAGNATYKAGNQGWLLTAGLLFPMR
jgi:hypothetical protein